MKLWNNIKLVEKGEVIQDDQEAAKELNTFFSSSFSFTLKENSTNGSFYIKSICFYKTQESYIKKKEKKRKEIFH